MYKQNTYICPCKTNNTMKNAQVLMHEPTLKYLIRIVAKSNTCMLLLEHLANYNISKELLDGVSVALQCPDNVDEDRFFDVAIYSYTYEDYINLAQYINLNS